MPRVVERTAGRNGELVLRADGDHLEIVSNGVFLMDTRDGRSERLLARAAVTGLPGPGSLLLGGLGVGFTLREALRSPLVAAVTVVELEPVVIAWNRTWLRGHSGDALADPRVEVVCDDLVEWVGRQGGSFDAICLDVDNGPGWTVTPANARLYAPDGLALLCRRLRPGGTLAVWSAAAAEPFEAELRRLFADVAALPVEVARGEPDVVYVARRPLGGAGS
jgi:spermidine synthase